VIRDILSRKPVVVTAEDVASFTKLKRPKKRFACHLCGHVFSAGDTLRFVMGKGSTINFFTCEGCDGDDVQDRFVEAVEESKRRFWWLYERIEDAYDDR